MSSFTLHRLLLLSSVGIPSAIGVVMAHNADRGWMLLWDHPPLRVIRLLLTTAPLWSAVLLAPATVILILAATISWRRYTGRPRVRRDASVLGLAGIWHVSTVALVALARAPVARPEPFGVAQNLWSHAYASGTLVYGSVTTVVLAPLCVLVLSLPGTVARDRPLGARTTALGVALFSLSVGCIPLATNGLVRFGDAYDSHLVEQVVCALWLAGAVALLWPIWLANRAARGIEASKRNARS